MLTRYAIPINQNFSIKLYSMDIQHKNLQWYKIAVSIEEIDFSASGLAEIIAGDKAICIAIHNNALHACAHKCPHAGGAMASGYTDALGNIVCPLHRYKFNLQNGRNVSGEGYFLKTFPVEQRGDGIYVGIED
jgi:nitrite reductase/ring-hydroxylating ferredoxin subunit